MRKILTAVIVIALAAVYVIYSKYYMSRGEGVAILQVIEHPALNATRNGITDYLKECCNINAEYENAHGNPALAIQIAQKLVQRQPKVIVAIGTLAAQSFLKQDTIPVIFSSVTDPVSSGLLSNYNSPNMNFTGVSNMVAILPQLQLFKRIKPSLTTLGIIYNAGEANSVVLLDRIKEAAVVANITIKEVVAGSSGEAILAAQKLAGDKDVDAIFITNDNTALSALQGIVKAATSHQMPVFCSDVDTINTGVVAAFGPNQYEIGVTTGKMVQEVLSGVSVEKIPVAFPEKMELIINLAAANKIGLHIDEDILKSAHQVVQ